MNKKAKHYHAGRIEVYDSKDKSGYASYEARFFVPKEIYHEFREMFDFKEFDRLPYIRFDYDEIKESEKDN